MRPIRVVIGDDDPGMLAALVDVLSADARFTVVGAASSGDELLHLTSGAQPDVVVLDVHMPGGGAAAAMDLGALPNPPAIVVLSGESRMTTVETMLRAGAVGYLAKGRAGATLPDLVARCADGHVMLAIPTAARALAALLRPPGGLR